MIMRTQIKIGMRNISMSTKGFAGYWPLTGLQTQHRLEALKARVSFAKQKFLRNALNLSGSAMLASWLRAFSAC